jgi:hypothetical protein
MTLALVLFWAALTCHPKGRADAREPRSTR